jgi:hypothetical protein
MYDMYRHLKLTPYRAMIPKDSPFPSERHAQNWRKVGTIETVSPEAKKHIDQKGFCVYIFTPTLSFDEIEGSSGNIGSTLPSFGVAIRKYSTDQSGGKPRAVIHSFCLEK